MKTVKVCLQCEQTFEYEVKRGSPQKYCSKACSNAYFVQNNPKYHAARHREKKYGLKEADFQRLFEAQGSKCAICPRTDDDTKGWWAVDHDHACCAGEKTCGMCVRGILCNDCNLALGRFGDNLDSLMNAMTYLMQFQNVLEVQHG